MDDRDDKPEDERMQIEKPIAVSELSALMPTSSRLDAMAEAISARVCAPVDLAPLMPSSDRVEAMAQAVVMRSTRPRLRDALPRELLRWSAPMLAAGIGLAACLWMVAPADTTTDPTSEVTQWAMSNESPTATHIFDTLGGEDTQ